MLHGVYDRADRIVLVMWRSYDWLRIQSVNRVFALTLTFVLWSPVCNALLDDTDDRFATYLCWPG
jgi:hypothetical protein